MMNVKIDCNWNFIKEFFIRFHCMLMSVVLYFGLGFSVFSLFQVLGYCALIGCLGRVFIANKNRPLSLFFVFSHAWVVYSLLESPNSALIIYLRIIFLIILFLDLCQLIINERKNTQPQGVKS